MALNNCAVKAESHKKADKNVHVCVEYENLILYNTATLCNALYLLFMHILSYYRHNVLSLYDL